MMTAMMTMARHHKGSHRQNEAVSGCGYQTHLVFLKGTCRSVQVGLPTVLTVRVLVQYCTSTYYVRTYWYSTVRVGLIVQPREQHLHGWSPDEPRRYVRRPTVLTVRELVQSPDKHLLTTCLRTGTALYEYLYSIVTLPHSLLRFIRTLLLVVNYDLTAILFRRTRLAHQRERLIIQ
jgi:hypothetical protein